MVKLKLVDSKVKGEKFMKSLMKFVFPLLLAGSALVFAGGGLEEPPGEPPHGVAVQSDAPGTKLNGEIMIEFYNIQSNGNANARFLLRLRKGNDFAMFYDEAFVTDFTSPTVVQTAIANALTQDVLNRFFNGATKTVKVKALEEFGELDTGNPPIPITVPSSRSVFILSDVVLAVQ
jgi:hypothetical protein